MEAIRQNNLFLENSGLNGSPVIKFGTFSGLFCTNKPMHTTSSADSFKQNTIDLELYSIDYLKPNCNVLYADYASLYYFEFDFHFR